MIVFALGSAADIRKRKQRKWIGQIVAVGSLILVAMGAASAAGFLTFNSFTPPSAPQAPVISAKSVLDSPAFSSDPPFKVCTFKG